MRETNEVIPSKWSSHYVSYVTFIQPQNHLGEKLFGEIKYAGNLSRQD